MPKTILGKNSLAEKTKINNVPFLRTTDQPELVWMFMAPFEDGNAELHIKTLWS